MPNSASLLAYPDCKKALENALVSERGIMLTWKTKAEATRFVGRCNAYRRLDRKENQKIYPEPAHTLHGRSVFDVLLITQDVNVVRIIPRKEADLTAIIEEL